MYKVVFFGTSDFSTPSLQALITDPRFEVKAVVTKPDMPVGRHQTVTEPPVKIIAKQNNIPYFQFPKIKTQKVLDTLTELQKSEEIDAYIVVSYGKIIPQNILDLPKKGTINVHGSLLPKHRGASCVQAAIAAGDEKSGVTIMILDAEMDHGDILAQKTTEIGPEETGGELHDRLAQLGADILPNTLADYLEGKIYPQPQNHNQASYCKILTRDDGRINWDQPAGEINNLIRAYNPWPGTWTIHNDKRIKILKAKVPQPIEGLALALAAWQVQDNRIFVGCGRDTILELLLIQPEGKKPMDIKIFLAGNKV